jgi:hypothetical protein
MLAVRSPSGASTVVVFAIALGASLAQHSTPELDEPIDLDAPAIDVPAIDIDEPACEGVRYEFVPYIYTPPVEPPRTREEAIERARPDGILGMIIARPCGDP